MGKKRQRHHEEEEEANMITERLPRSHPTKRPRREAPVAPSSSSVNHLKGKVRDVTRTLERSKHLPENVRIEKERALAGYKVDLGEAENEKRKKHMIKKYHMVRFFGQWKISMILCLFMRCLWVKHLNSVDNNVPLQSAKKPQESSSG